MPQTGQIMKKLHRICFMCYVSNTCSTTSIIYYYNYLSLLLCSSHSEIKASVFVSQGVTRLSPHCDPDDKLLQIMDGRYNCPKVVYIMFLLCCMIVHEFMRSSGMI